MMTDRVTRFAVQSNGSRSFSVTVNGLRVLVTADEGQHAAGDVLAHAIAALGPEMLPAVPSAPAPEPVTAPPAKKRDFTVGQTIWCNVHNAEGYCKVTEVGVGRNKGRIKISGMRAWCPIYNFDEKAPAGRFSEEEA